MKPNISCHRKIEIKQEIKNDVLKEWNCSSPSKSLLCIVLLKETVILMFHKNLSGDFLFVVDIILMEERFICNSNFVVLRKQRTGEDFTAGNFVNY